MLAANASVVVAVVSAAAVSVVVAAVAVSVIFVATLNIDNVTHHRSFFYNINLNSQIILVILS